MIDHDRGAVTDSAMREYNTSRILTHPAGCGPERAAGVVPVVLILVLVVEIILVVVEVSTAAVAVLVVVVVLVVRRTGLRPAHGHRIGFAEPGKATAHKV